MALEDKLTQHTEKKITHMRNKVFEQKKEANSTIMTEVNMSVTDVETFRQQHCLWL